ncbi:MAG: DUF2141 domain-containing protein [Thermoanaerobaculales bacterium]|nr:DUF2141 domain-containing protein [Thermoanaerobaculales bacterium]
MIHRRQRLPIVLVAVTLCACASAPPEALEARPSGTGRVEVTMTGFKSEQGQALVALYLDAEGWPDAEGFAFSTAVVPIREARAIAEFEEVPAGPFAVSVFHDKDEDRELDSVAGIPSEDYGFSADARDLFGPPSFSEASLELAAGESMRITIRVK